MIGGAAMAVAYGARRATTDVDAVFVPSKEVRTAAWRVAEELGREEDCLNDGVKGFLAWNDRCRPFVWNRTPVKILSHARRRPTLDARH